MPYNFDTLIDRRNTDSIKWGHYPPDVLPLWIADMDFAAPPPVIEALQERVAQGIFGYGAARPELLETIAARMESLYDWAIRPEDVILLPGVIGGFNMAAHAFSEPGEGILVQTPVYPPILKAHTATRRVQHAAMLVRLPSGEYEIDFEQLEAAIQPDTRLFILCNPHNPVGRVFRPDELQRIAEICLRHKLMICSDEIHSDIVFDGRRHTPIASLAPEIASRTITLMAPSKSFNLAGLACSFAIVTDPAVRRQYNDARQGLLSWVNILAQVAALAAYREGQPWLEELLVYLQANRDYLNDFVQAELPGIHLHKPEGTFLTWLDCRELSVSEKACEFFREKAGVGLNDGLEFGPDGAGFVRLNFGTPRLLLQQALEKMKTAVAALQIGA